MITNLVIKLTVSVNHRHRTCTAQHREQSVTCLECAWFTPLDIENIKLH